MNDIIKKIEKETSMIYEIHTKAHKAFAKLCNLRVELMNDLMNTNTLAIDVRQKMEMYQYLTAALHCYSSSELDSYKAMRFLSEKFSCEKYAELEIASESQLGIVEKDQNGPYRWIGNSKLEYKFLVSQLEYILESKDTMTELAYLIIHDVHAHEIVWQHDQELVITLRGYEHCSKEVLHQVICEALYTEYRDHNFDLLLDCQRIIEYLIDIASKRAGI